MDAGGEVARRPRCAHAVEVADGQRQAQVAAGVGAVVGAGDAHVRQRRGEDPASVAGVQVGDVALRGAELLAAQNSSLAGTAAATEAAF